MRSSASPSHACADRTCGRIAGSDRRADADGARILRHRRLGSAVKSVKPGQFVIGSFDAHFLARITNHLLASVTETVVTSLPADGLIVTDCRLPWVTSAIPAENEPITNCPGLIEVTALPTSSTMPQYSCPIGVGSVTA